MAEKRTLPQMLWDLAHAIGEEARQAVATGAIAKTDQLYRRVVVHDFDYMTSRKTVGSELESKESWDLRTSITARDLALQSKDFQDTVSEICSRYTVNQPQAEFWLTLFTSRVLADPENPLANGALAELMTTFVADLEGAPKHWHGTAALQGLRLEPVQIELGDSAIIRQTKKEDFEHEDPLYSVLSGFPSGRPDDLGTTVDSFLEVDAVGQDNRAINREVGLYLQCLRLYRAVSVFYFDLRARADSILQMGTLGGGPIYRPAPNLRILLTQDDGDSLRGFCSFIVPLLPEAVLPGSSEAGTFVATALTRYNEALTQPLPVDARLTTLIMSLEALMLKSEEREELSERLALRAARLLGHLGRSPVAVYERVRRAYSLRSRYVHGDHLNPEDIRLANELYGILVEDVRRLVVLNLVLADDGAGTDKDQLLNQVTRSLIDDTARERLSNRLADGIARMREVGALPDDGPSGSDEEAGDDEAS